MPNTIERTRNTLKQHPIIAAVVVLMALALAPPIGVVLALAAGAVFVLPELIRPATPEQQLADLEAKAKAAALHQIQTTSVLGADLKQLERYRAVAQQHADRWQSRAEKALLSGDEAEASRCLGEKRACVARIEQLDDQISKQRPAVEAMNQAVDQQLGAARELRQHGAAVGLVVVAQRRRIDARRQAALARAGLGDDRTLEGIAAKQDREELEVEQLEAIVDRQRNPYAAAEQSEQERAELEALRQKVGMGRKALGSGGV